MNRYKEIIKTMNMVTKIVVGELAGKRIIRNFVGGGKVPVVPVPIISFVVLEKEY